jgi:hypothetical protein
MRRVIKSVINYVPFSSRLINSSAFYRCINVVDAIRARSTLDADNVKSVFTDIYEQNIWDNDESVSGDGSTLEYTANLRASLPELFQEFGITSILDAPCGDHNWFRYVERPENVSYVGGEIVDELVASNATKYSNDRTSFIKLDIIADPLPSVDLFFCRDVLFHFSFGDIFRTLENFASSRIKYIFTTSHTRCRANVDIKTGQFRLLNLRERPFSLPEPIYAVDDWIDGYPERQMCLWTRETIAAALTGRRPS